MPLAKVTTFGCRCNKLDKKDYYPIFKLTGFTGFDGSFKNWKQSYQVWVWNGGSLIFGPERRVRCGTWIYKENKPKVVFVSMIISPSWHRKLLNWLWYCSWKNPRKQAPSSLCSRWLFFVGESTSLFVLCKTVWKGEYIFHGNVCCIIPWAKMSRERKLGVCKPWCFVVTRDIGFI